MYTPDKAVLLKFAYNGEVTYKIFATWYGGYLSGDSWQLNSGIERVEMVDDNTADVIGFSGSIYRVRLDSHGTSAYTGGVLTSLMNQTTELGATVDWFPLTDLKTLNDVLKSMNDS